MRRPLHFIALLAMLCSLFVAACGSDEEEPAPGGGTTAEETPAKEAIKVGLVTDIGGLNDRSFNQLANEGLERAKSELGVETRVLISKANSDYVPNLSTLAQQQYDLVIGVGFLMAEAMNTVAPKFPKTNFAIIDVDATGLESKPTNVAGVLFKENEAGYLVGYMAGLYIKDEGGGTASSVGGQKIPPVDALHRRATRRASRPPTRTRRSSTATRRSSMTRRRARSSRSITSPRGRRSSSRSPVAAASARWTPPRRRACRASAWTPTRPTSVTRS